ncbi:MAG: hypothetical protein AB7L09_13385 [Nitrospira sp.]
MGIPPVLIARHLCELLPAQIQTRVFGDHAFVSQYGRLSRTVLTIGGKVSIEQYQLVAAARRLLAGQGDQKLKDISGNHHTVMMDRGAVILKMLGEKDQEQHIALSGLAVLSPDFEQRVQALKLLTDSFGPTAPDFSALMTAAESRELTDEEIVDLLDERSTGFASYKARIEMAHRADHVEVNDIVPDSLHYYELYCGPDPRLLPPEEYLSVVLPTYRQQLLRRNLVKGLEICLLGALRDDLGPATWTTNISDDDMWDALATIDTRANPFAALGVLDIAITRQHDSRYEALASNVIIELGKDSLLRPDGVDCYEILPLFAQLTFHQINMMEGGALRAPFWKRLCAWMHACLLLQSTLDISIKLDAFREWVYSNRDVVGSYAQMIDLRLEPMYRAGEFSRLSLREEIIGRLVVLRARHQAAGRFVPNPDAIDAAMARLREKGSPLGWAMPGPLDGHIRPANSESRKFSDVDIATALEELSKDPSGAIWSKLAYFSQCFGLGEKILAHACQAVTTAPFDHELDRKERPTRLFDITLIAAAHRNKDLANSIATISLKKAPLATTEKSVITLLQIILTASAAFENEREWSSWVSEQLARLAYNLPAGESTKTLYEHLAAIRMVLPISMLVCSQAESVCSAAI